MTENLQEFVDSSGTALRVDRQQSLIRGVKVLGLVSRNGRTYAPEAVAAAASLYEGIKVNVNHPKGSPHAPRDYQDRLGVLRGVSVRDGEGLFATLHFNPKHALAEQLLWDAEHAPENVGLSHNVEARTARRGDAVVVEAIERVNSVDLVADPATTRSLFESAGSSAQADEAWQGLTLEALQAVRPELVAELVREQKTEIAHLRNQLEHLQVAEALAERRRLVRRLLAEHRLPDPELCGTQAGSLVSASFLAQLLEAHDEPTLRKLIQERARLVTDALRWEGDLSRGSARTLSREQAAVERLPEAIDGRSFARAIS